jgi:hypothetical protein
MPLDKCELPVADGFDQRIDRLPTPGRDLTAPKGVLRRFPPVLQFLTRQRADVAAELNRLVSQGYERGLNLSEIRGELVAYAASQGFSAFIRVHEVRTEDMPSFPGQTILTGMFLVDLRPGPAEYDFRYPA